MTISQQGGVASLMTAHVVFEALDPIHQQHLLDALPDDAKQLFRIVDRAELGLHRLHGALAHEVGEFLDLHTLLLDDPELLQGLDDLVRKGQYAADYALRLQRDRLAAVFESMDDAYFRSRVEDIDHVIGRVHATLHRRDANLRGVAGEILVGSDPY